MDEEVSIAIEDSLQLIVSAKYVTALTGAGVSVESGIRTFRGPGGLRTERGEPSKDSYQRFMQARASVEEVQYPRDSYVRGKPPPALGHNVKRSPPH